MTTRRRAFAALRPEDVPGASLGVGRAGVAVVHHLLGAEPPGGRAGPWRDALIEAVEAEPLGVGLFDGLAGVAWAFGVVGDLRSRRLVEDALVGAIERGDEVGAELVAGLGGVALYASTRGRAGTPLLAAAVRALDARAVPVGVGLAWPGGEPAEGWGRWDLGVAHGVAGVLPGLAGAIALGVERERALRLFDGAVALLGAASAPLPSTLDPTVPGRRDAWCYGSMGAGVVLRAAGRRARSRTAVALGERFLAATVLPSTWASPCLCHGAAGAAVFLRAAGRPVTAAPPEDDLGDGPGLLGGLAGTLVPSIPHGRLRPLLRIFGVA